MTKLWPKENKCYPSVSNVTKHPDVKNPVLKQNNSEIKSINNHFRIMYTSYAYKIQSNRIVFITVMFYRTT